MSDDVLHTIARHENICNYIHLPVQSGSSRILKLMNRGHNREEYFNLIDRVRKIIPDCGISMDMISGFPTETEEDHQETLSLMEYVRYHFGFMFFYSERPSTYAARKMEDDIPLEVKKRRLNEIIELQQKHSLERNKEQIGRIQDVLIEGSSKRSDEFWFGRNSQNTVVVFPKNGEKAGDRVNVLVESCTTATLLGNRITE
jgi:tRNA-2-methylthio-N6-dimethylallyladenosine synthase